MDALPSRVGQENAIIETGPRFLSRVLLSGGLGGDFTLFPMSWFFPYRADQPERSLGPFPDSYGVHHWGHSWDDPAEHYVRTRAQRRLRRVIAAARGK